jgi:hypothetical protein
MSTLLRERELGISFRITTLATIRIGKNTEPSPLVRETRHNVRSESIQNYFILQSEFKIQLSLHVREFRIYGSAPNISL